MTALMIALGLAGLFAGGHFLVSGAAGLATRLGVPAFVIGLTIVGFGTSLPELLVSVLAALGGQPGIAIGNVIGSNIANILLILGLSALIAPLAAPPSIRRDLLWMLGSSGLCLPLVWNGHVGLLEGGILLACLSLFLLDAFRRPDTVADTLDGPPARPLWQSVLAALAGLGAILLGAQALIGGATEAARAFGVSEAVIGLTLVAVGTSLPELATSVIAAFKGQRDIAIGNVVGSNIFNVLGILGATAVIAPIPVEARFVTADIPLMLVVSLVLAGLLVGPKILGRIVALAALALYAGYSAAAGLL